MLDMSIRQPTKPPWAERADRLCSKAVAQGMWDNPALSLDAYICSLRVYVKERLGWGIASVWVGAGGLRVGLKSRLCDMRAPEL
jgi:hypothetical protein